MKCQNCGAEIHEPNVKYCPECGSPIPQIHEINNNALETIEERMKWWYSMPFIWGLFVISTIFWPLFFVVVVLLIIRIIKYPKKRLIAILNVIIPIMILLGGIIYICFNEFQSQGKKNEIRKEISNDNYDHAIKLINEYYSESSYNYSSFMADVYDKQKDYDNEAKVLMDYIIDNKINSSNNLLYEKLIDLKDNVSDKTYIEIEDIKNSIESKENKKIDNNSNIVVSDSANNPSKVVSEYLNISYNFETDKYNLYLDKNVLQEYKDITSNNKLLYEEYKKATIDEWIALAGELSFCYSYFSGSKSFDGEYLRKDKDLKKASDDWVKAIWKAKLSSKVDENYELLPDGTAVVSVEFFGVDDFSSLSETDNLAKEFSNELMTKSISTKMKEKEAKKYIKNLIIDYMLKSTESYNNMELPSIGKSNYYLNKNDGKWKIYDIKAPS